MTRAEALERLVKAATAVSTHYPFRHDVPNPGRKLWLAIEELQEALVALAQADPEPALDMDSLRAQRDALVEALKTLHPEAFGHEGWKMCGVCAALAAGKGEVRSE